MTGASVTISLSTLQSGDHLNFANQNGITGSYSAGVLTLTGSATPAQYQAALQSVTFSSAAATTASTSTSSTTRLISIVTWDGGISSNSAAEQMIVLAPLSYQTLYSNVSTLGYGPTGDLTAVGSVLYGANATGSGNDGVIYSINSDGTGLRVVRTFSGGPADGSDPNGIFVVVGSTLYGTTRLGGADNDGTIFSMNTDGTDFQILHSFTNTSTDGSSPEPGLALIGSTLYGATESGGSNGYGTVFSISTSGNGFQVLHSFSFGSDGALPFAGLIAVGSSVFGTTVEGGSGGDGTVFSVNTVDNSFRLLQSFSGSNGGLPYADLTAIGSTLFGTTEFVAGGTGSVFSVNTDGSDFQVLHSFSGPDGTAADFRLAAVGQTLFGTTNEGGGDGYGNVFSINANGTDFQIVHTFTDTGSDGATPQGGLTLVGSSLFGTSAGGATATARCTRSRVQRRSAWRLPAQQPVTTSAARPWRSTRP